MNRKLIAKAFKDTVPVLAGYIVIGLGFGLVLRSHGYGLIWAVAMSVFIYAGSMQYVAIGLMTGGASIITTALTTLMVNARHLFYGISMVERYKGAGRGKWYTIFALTDETYSLVCEDPEGVAKEDYHKYVFLISIMNHAYWVLGSALGSLFGSVVTFNTEGIDFALTALFLTVLTEQWLTNKNHFPAITGLVLTAASLLIFGADSFLIPAMLAITAVLLLGKKMMKGGRDDG